VDGRLAQCWNEEAMLDRGRSRHSRHKQLIKNALVVAWIIKSSRDDPLGARVEYTSENEDEDADRGG
jgi:hypothetical protein